jgi:hypothetical protein
VFTIKKQIVDLKEIFLLFFGNWAIIFFGESLVDEFHVNS